MATPDASFDYKLRHEEASPFARTYFRRCGDIAVSSIGVGTYLGDPTDAVDESYYEALTTALAGGVNVVDTAINYRHQRSERVVGRALADAEVDRDEVFVSTKGGFVAFDGERPADPSAYVRKEYIDAGLAGPNDFARGSHCIAPDYIEAQLDRSLENLDVEEIDLYYVHNPETQLLTRSRAEVYDQLEETFTRLEERAAAGDIRRYGVATWDAFRVPKGHESYLALPEVISRARAAARAAGNAATHLRAIQLPFNVYMADAFTVSAHDAAEGTQSALWFAHEAGLNVFTSASLAQGEVVDGIPDAVAARLSGETNAQRAINFARSAPGVTCALVGMGSPAHVEENIAAGTFEPMGADSFDAVFE